MDLEWMVREAVSGRAWRGRQHRGGDRGNGNDCGMKNGDCTGMVSSISPAARGQKHGSEYVSTRTRTHPLSSQPPHTPNPIPYLWVRVGIRAIPARV